MCFLSMLSLIYVLHASQPEHRDLDIGGIELRLGQDISGALKALSSYQIRYSDLGSHWVISQKGVRPFELLGTLSATDGKVSSIIKHYWFANRYDAARVYSQASKETRRRGGSRCETRELKYTNDLIYGVETRCGLYRLSYSFPSNLDVGDVEAGISIQLSVN